MAKKAQSDVSKNLSQQIEKNNESKIYERVKIEEELKDKLRLEEPTLLRFIDHRFIDRDLEKANENIQRNVEYKL